VSATLSIARERKANLQLGQALFLRNSTIASVLAPRVEWPHNNVRGRRAWDDQLLLQRLWYARSAMLWNIRSRAFHTSRPVLKSENTKRITIIIWIHWFCSLPWNLDSDLLPEARIVRRGLLS
jgi:hypothetical protein